MRRTTALTATALLGLALIGPTPAATAAGETCQGHAATMVGRDGSRILGTEGSDVVVTNGASEVQTLGGDDLVCATLHPTRPDGGEVTVDLGTGDDVLDGSPRVSVRGQLGAGADRFQGGSESDLVAAGSLTQRHAHLDTDADVLLGGGGNDVLTSGQRSAGNADVVDAGDGDDVLHLLGAQSGGSTSGGTGVDVLHLLLASGDSVLDNVAGRLTTGGAVAQSWTDVESFGTDVPGGGAATLVFVGGPGSEALDHRADGVLHATMGAGDDVLHTLTVPAAGSRVDAGPGRDFFFTASPGHALDLDLDDEVLAVGDDARAVGDDARAVGDGAYRISVTDLEEAHLVARRVTLSGTDGSDALYVLACRATVEGRGGADRIARLVDYEYWVYVDLGCPERLVLRGGGGRDHVSAGPGSDLVLGGRGADRMRGSGGDDRLLGGPGADSAIGSQGRDLCRAERVRRCER